MSLIPPRSAWTVGLGTTLAFGNWGALPWIIGAVVEGAGFRADAAAFLGTVELTVMGLSMLVIAPLIPRLSRAKLAAVTLPIAVGAQFVSAYTSDYYTMMAVRALSGAAFGAIFSVATAEGADAKEPDRAFAAASVIVMICGILKSPLMGYSKQLFGYKGVFLALGGYYALVGAPLLLLLFAAPPRTSRSQPARPAGAAAGFPLLASVGVLMVMGAYSLATGGVYAFIERVATHAGLTASALGRGFAVTALIATLGGTAAARLGLKWGRPIPTLGSLVVLGALSVFVMSVSSIPAFWAGYIPWAIVYWFSYAYIMGLSVLVDPLGRLATVTSAVLILTGAAGAALAGVLTQHRGLPSFGLAAGGICVLGAVAAGLVLRNRPEPVGTAVASVP